ncbi:hypothetical protein HYY27_07070 [bacterium]|nr:hypothetical protein [bacterium]
MPIRASRSFPDSAPPEPLPARQGGATWRALGIGAAVAAFINAWSGYSEYIVRSSRLNMSNFPLDLFASFLLVIVVLNGGLKWVGRRLALSPSELIVILCVGLASAFLSAADGAVGYAVAVMAAPYYFATPENQWAQYFHDHIPAWIAPMDRGGAVTYFYEGLPPGLPIPWREWLAPLSWWGALLCAAAFASLCIAVILRKQWVQNEKLVYPLVTITADLVRDAQEEGLRPGFTRGGLFWAGFSLTCGIIVWNIGSYFQPGFPQIPLGGWIGNTTNITLSRGFPSIPFKINFFTVGFAYFANLEVLFSLWLFFLLHVVEMGVCNRFGLTVGAIADQWGSLYEIASWQGFGALCVFVLFGLYMARAHLRDVALKALRADHPADDSGEMMSYRTAFFGFLLSFGFILGWFWQAGMEFKLALPYVIGTFILYIGVARIVAEMGLLYVRGPLTAQSMAVYSWGADALSPASLTAVAFSYGLVSYRGLFMPAMSHIAKLADATEGSRRRIGTWAMTGLLVGGAVTVGLTFIWAYDYGAFNFNVWPFASGGRAGFNMTLTKMRDAFPTDWRRMELFGVGAAAMGVMTFLRYRFTWWPIHPIGLTVSGTNFTNSAAISVFLVWVVKGIILRVGGVTLYNRYRPLFIGILVGYAVGVTISFVVDVVWFPGNGHPIHYF